MGVITTTKDFHVFCLTGMYLKFSNIKFSVYFSLIAMQDGLLQFQVVDLVLCLCANDSELILGCRIKICSGKN